MTRMIGVLETTDPFPDQLDVEMTTEQEARQVAALAGLLDVSLALANEDDPERILQIVAHDACSALGCERASLFLFDEEREHLVTTVATQLELSELRISLDRGIIGWVARERRLANVPDPSADGRWEGTADKATGFRTRSILAAPVIARSDGALLGVLQLLNCLDGPFDDFDEQLIQAFAEHAGAALERQRLQDSVRRNAEYRSALEVGRRIQRSFLPESLPTVPGYELAVFWQPAEYVSGDYYDCLPLPDGRWMLVIADVSGHGLGSALVMASARAMVHALAQSPGRPDQFLERLEAALRPDLQDGLFLSALIAFCDPVTHEVEYANAGHAPAYRIDRREQTAVRLETTRTPIGFPTVLPPEGPLRTRLAPGDFLVLGTDGLIEVRDEEGNLFGSKRFRDMILERQALPAEDLVCEIGEVLADYQGSLENQDDMTLLIWERKLEDHRGPVSLETSCR